MKLLYLVNYWPGLFITGPVSRNPMAPAARAQRGCRVSWHSRPAFV